MDSSVSLSDELIKCANVTEVPTETMSITKEHSEKMHSLESELNITEKLAMSDSESDPEIKGKPKTVNRTINKLIDTDSDTDHTNEPAVSTKQQETELFNSESSDNEITNLQLKLPHKRITLGSSSSEINEQEDDMHTRIMPNKKQKKLRKKSFHDKMRTTSNDGVKK